MKLSTIAYQIIDLEPEIDAEKSQAADQCRIACCNGDRKDCVRADANTRPAAGCSTPTVSCQLVA